MNSITKRRTSDVHGGNNVKQCPKCKQLLDKNKFHKSRSRKDNLRCYCKDCCRELTKEYDDRPEVKERRKQREQQPEVRKKKREYIREYRERPEVKERLKEYRKKYHQRPEVKEQLAEQHCDPKFQKYKKEYMVEYRKEYLQRPEVKEHIRIKRNEYRQQPEVKERRRIKAKKYNNRPEIKERNRRKRQNPKYKEHKKEYYKKWLQNPEVQERLKKYRNEYYQNIENKERVKNYLKNNPDKVKTWNRNHFNKRKQLGTTTIMDNPFPEDVKVDFHHFNNLMMVPMPRVTHRFVTGSAQNINKHYYHNEKWIRKLYGLGIYDLFYEKGLPCFQTT